MAEGRREQLAADIAAAVAAGEVVPAFQPVVRLQDAALEGFEVLARWCHPRYGDVPPAEFIPLARAGGVLEALTLRLISAACTAAGGWPGGFYLAFNVPPDLLQQRGAADRVVAAVGGTGFPPSRARVEMTEEELFEDAAEAQRTIGFLKSLGIKVVLDDFGTGYSSLTRLHSFAFDQIKIDGSFVRRIEEDAGSRKIVAAVIGLGHSLQAGVVAECVETRAQADYLARLGCNSAQGWLFGRPMPATGVPGWIAEQWGDAGRAGTPLLSPYHRQLQMLALYEAAPVGLCFVDNDNRYAAANREFCRMIGRPPEQVVGRTVREVFDPEQARMVEAMIESDRSGLVLPREMRMVGGEDVFLVCPAQVNDEEGVLQGVSVVAVNITDRKRSEDALRASETHYRNAVECSPSVLWDAEAGGRLSYISPMADEPEGWSIAQRIEAWYARMEPDDRLRVRGEWEAWLPLGQPFETRFRVLWSDGSWRWVRSQARPHREDGRIVRWFGAFTDITREVELEQRLARLERGAP